MAKHWKKIRKNSSRFIVSMCSLLFLIPVLLPVAAAWQEQGSTDDFSVSYQNSVYYQRLKEVVLTGNYRDDFLAVAASQLGYCEGDQAGQLDGSSPGTRDCTEYGRYLDSNGTAWCSEFASWCARQAGVPFSILANSRTASRDAFRAPGYSWQDTIYAGGSFTPRPGDLVLFAWDGTPATANDLSHTAIVREISVTDDFLILTTIDGNSHNMVRVVDRAVTFEDGKVGKGCVAYFIAPEYEPQNYVFSCAGVTDGMVSVSMQNGTSVIQSPVFILALYDGMGRMTACDLTSGILSPSESLVLSCPVGGTETTLQAFVLDGITYAPLRGQWSIAL